MILVVADTGPLNYLVQIGAIDLLPKLFECVAIPPAVLHELLDAGTPPEVREWITNLPDWIVVRTPRVVEDLKLERGETEAIALSQELNASALLVDDLAARIIAERRSIAIVGTTGLLERAAAKHLLDLNEAFGRLRATTFRGSNALYDAALARDADRKRAEK
jgi:predicted nucleic acid-binding protein